MNDEIRERLENIVWGDKADPHSLAKRVMKSFWLRGPHVHNAMHVWAFAQSCEYDKKCKAMKTKCDLTDPGIEVLYNHYYNIRERYRLVQMAYGPDYYER